MLLLLFYQKARYLYLTVTKPDNFFVSFFGRRLVASHFPCSTSSNKAFPTSGVSVLFQWHLEHVKMILFFNSDFGVVRIRV